MRSQQSREEFEKDERPDTSGRHAGLALVSKVLMVDEGLVSLSNHTVTSAQKELRVRWTRRVRTLSTNTQGAKRCMRLPRVSIESCFRGGES